MVSRKVLNSIPVVDALTPIGYATQAEVEAMFGSTITNTNLSFYLRSAEDYINNYCNTIFIEPANDVTFSYDGTGEPRLDIDTFTSITEVSIDDEVVTVTNEQPNQEYFSAIRYEKCFPLGVSNVSVTGKFGTATEVPADIKFVTSVLTVGMVNSASSTASGDIKKETIGRYSVEYETSSTGDTSEKVTWASFSKAHEILGNYKSFYRFG